MKYEFEKYCTDEKDILKMLDIYGVAIIPNLLNNNECEKINDGIWNYFEHVSKNWNNDFTPIKRNDTKTWRNIYNLFPLHNHLFKHFGVGHSQICWDLRQNEKIINIFEKIWNCPKDDLLVSFDGFSFCLPPEITNKGWEHNTWFHTDQSYLRNDFECVQSWITANDIEEGDGTLAIMEGSHQYHEEFKNKFNINDSSDWYKLNSIEEKFYENKKCEYKKIKCPKGSLVLWDSRTIHYGANPVKKRKNPNFRSIIYLCYMKKELCSIKDIIKKQNMFHKKQTTNHWPCKPKANNKFPQTYGKKIPEILDIEEPNINNIGKNIAGLNF